MRTYIYVDGFNLYYGALKGTAWKWLDMSALLAKVLQPQHDDQHAAAMAGGLIGKCFPGSLTERD